MSSTSAQAIAPPQYTYPPVTIILTIILLIFFFVGFFAIYFCRCFIQNLFFTFHLRHTPSGTPGGTAVVSSSGLDPTIVRSFPTFAYSSVKDYRKEKYGLECAICLVEFNGSDVLRLLTTCCHVFHQGCVDLWLEMHTTCPVCRKKLDSPAQSPMKSPSNIVHEIDYDGDNDDISITIRSDNEADREGVGEKGQRCLCQSDEQREYGIESSKVEKFSRSHSTGHSIVINTEDRYTLRLPEHLKTKIIKGHISSKSWSTFGEYTDKGNSARNVAGASGEYVTNKA